MNKENEQLEALTEIRSLMERSSRFISLSGLSGVFAGVFALVGMGAAYNYLNLEIGDPTYFETAFDINGSPSFEFFSFFFADALTVLVASLVVGSFLTLRKAKQKGLSIWDPTAKRLLINLILPLIAGGLFCLILMNHGFLILVAPTMLLFYGMALLNASKYTLNDIRYLGMCEMGLGLVAAFYLNYGLLFWGIGFGVLHIIYGTVMYYKYER